MSTIINPIMKQLKIKGYKFNKKNWPTIPQTVLVEIGISREEFARYTHSATLSETMGPNWKYGIMLQTGKKDSVRPVAFNENF